LICIINRLIPLLVSKMYILQFVILLVFSMSLNAQDLNLNKIFEKEKKIRYTSNQDSLANLYFSLYELYYYIDEQKSNEYLIRYFKQAEERQDSLRIGMYYYRITMHNFYNNDFLEVIKSSKIASSYLKNYDTLFYLESIQLQLRAKSYLNIQSGDYLDTNSIEIYENTAYSKFPMQMAKVHFYNGLSAQNAHYSILNLKKALPYLLQVPHNNLLLHVYHQLSEKFKINNELDSALKYGELSWELTKDTIRYNEVDFLLPAQNYQDLLNKVGKYDEALAISKKIQIKRTIAKIASTENFNFILRTAYLEYLRNKERDKNILIVSIAVLFFTVFIVVIFFHIKLRKNRKKLFKSNQLNEILLKENHHRVKNNYQMMMSLININQDEENFPHHLFVEHLRAKITSMARTHQLLLQNSSDPKIDGHIFFTEVIGSLKDSLKLENQGISLNFSSGKHEIKTDKIIILGLIINELVTNSLKYAFKGLNTHGEINLTLTMESSNYILKYEELGGGNKFEKNKKMGTGMEIIQSLVKQIYGEIDFSTENGMTVFIRFKS